MYQPKAKKIHIEGCKDQLIKQMANLFKKYDKIQMRTY